MSDETGEYLSEKMNSLTNDVSDEKPTLKLAKLFFSDATTKTPVEGRIKLRTNIPLITGYTA